MQKRMKGMDESEVKIDQSFDEVVGGQREASESASGLLCVRETLVPRIGLVEGSRERSPARALGLTAVGVDGG